MNDKEVKEMLENEQVPEELEPERIKAMLDEKAPAVKRKKITAVSRFAAIAAACAVVSGTAVYVAGHGNNINKDKGSQIAAGTVSGSNDLSGTAANVSDQTAITTEAAAVPDVPSLEPVTQAAYMSGAENYDEIYELLCESYEDYKRSGYKNYGGRYYLSGMIDDEDIAYAEESNGEVKNSDPPKTSGVESSTEYSDTFNQEDGVLEADMVKTDGKTIYILNSYSYGDECNIKTVKVDNGRFVSSESIDINSKLKELGGGKNRAYFSQLYLYNDMVLVIGTSYNDDYIETNAFSKTSARLYYQPKTVVLAFSTDDDHKLIGSYAQEGCFSDVRISPDGYMYLISDYSSCNATDIIKKDDVRFFIPHTGTFNDMSPVKAADILMPEDGIEPSMQLGYSVISSLDLNTAGSMTVSATKALAGYTGQIYCSADNLYTAAYNYGDYLRDDEEVEYGFTVDKTSETDITRIAISGGKITPEASGKIAGVVNDQFSMSEYNGYFRIATTCDEYKMTYKKGEYYESYSFNEETGSYYELAEPEKVEYGYYSYDDVKRDNRLYVLDLDLRTVGSVGGFGLDESVKSVNFNGDMAYVVTYEQTDPLFAIDLSEPTAPKILDEFKMLGYSSYMQKWDDEHLVGFGPDADEDGRVTGLKLVMFDNSDPNELKLDGFYSINRNDDSWVSSIAQYDRKALFIQPEKNLVGFPVSIENYNNGDSKHWSIKESYMFFSYEDGKLVPRGEIANEINYGDKQYDIDYGLRSEFMRAVYIGDYIYAVAGDGIYSADMDTITVKDSISFRSK